VQITESFDPGRLLEGVMAGFICKGSQLVVAMVQILNLASWGHRSTLTLIP